MDYKKVINNLDSLADMSNPVKTGDFRDDKGLLHCGKCGALMEFVQKLENIKISTVFYNELDAEHRQRVDDMRNWLAGRKHRIPCRCKEEERRAYEREQRKQYIKDNVNFCFGKLSALRDCVFELDDCPNEKKSKVSRQYASDFKKYADVGWSLIYTGDVGHGKTFYACAVANKLLQDGYKVKFTSVNDVIGQANQYFLSIATLVDSLCENDLVILDDFGTEHTSDKVQSMMYQLINGLHERKKSLIITTNIKSEEFKNPTTTEQRRIYSRLIQNSTILSVNTAKGDRRTNQSS